jgi:hypothetical protein
LATNASRESPESQKASSPQVESIGPFVGRSAESVVPVRYAAPSASTASAKPMSSPLPPK